MNAPLHKEIRSVVKRYGLHARTITGCNSHYLENASFRVDTSEGFTVLVKPFRGSDRKLTALTRAVHSLQSKDYPYMAKWLTTPKGHLQVKEHDQHYYLTEWVDGRTFGQHDSDFYELGEALATLHTRPIQTRDYHKRAASRILERVTRQYQRFQQSLTAVVDEDSVHGEWYRQNKHVCTSLSDSGMQTLCTPDILNTLRTSDTVRIHGDVTRPNIIVSESGVRLIDWDSTLVSSGLVELAKALANTTDFRIAAIQQLLTGYERNRPLSQTDRQIVCTFYRLPREAWAMIQDGPKNRNLQLFHIVSKTWDARLKAISFLTDWSRTQ